MTHKDENESNNDDVQNHMMSQETVLIEEVRILRPHLFALNGDLNLNHSDLVH